MNKFSKNILTNIVMRENRFRIFIVRFILLILLIGLSYIILYPFIFKILASFMSDEDVYDSMVELIPKHWVLERYTNIIQNINFLSGLKNTFFYSTIVAFCTMFSSAFVGYGLARFRFFGNKAVLFLIIATMFIPLQTICLPLYTQFRFFDIFGILKAIRGNGISLLNTPLPMALLGITCLGFRGGIFIILMRQYYIGIPKELIEAAYVDGSTVIKTYFKIIIPMARSMQIVIFSLSFAWQWTDTFYSNILNANTKLLPNFVLMLNSVSSDSSIQYVSYINANTAAIAAVIPLLIFYCFLQKKIIQGIETSGVVG